MTGIDGVQVGPFTALAGLLLFGGAIWLVVRHTGLALIALAAAAGLGLLFWLLFGTMDMIAHPLLGLIVIAVGGAIGNASNKRK